MLKITQVNKGLNSNLNILNFTQVLIQRFIFLVRVQAVVNIFQLCMYE